MSVWVGGLGVPYIPLFWSNKKPEKHQWKMFNKTTRWKETSEKCADIIRHFHRNFTAGSWHVMALPPCHIHVTFMSLFMALWWHPKKNMAPNTFMPFSRRFHGTCPQNFKIIIIQYIMFMSLWWHFLQNFSTVMIRYTIFMSDPCHFHNLEKVPWN